MSVSTISALERTKFNDEFRTDFEQEESLFMKAVRSDGLMAAGVVKWDVSGLSDEAQERGRDGKIPVSKMANSQVSDVPKEWFKKYKVDDFDVFKGNPNYRAQQYRKCIAPLKRKCDKRVIEILDTTTNETNSGSAVDFGDFGKMLTWVTTLWANDVPSDGNVWGAVTPHALAQMMTINEFKNADYTEVKKVDGGAAGYGQNGYWTWLGVNWFQSTLLSGVGTTTADCHIWHKDAVCHQISGEPEMHMYYDEGDDFWGTWGKYRDARALALPRGVIRQINDDTATIG